MSQEYLNVTITGVGGLGNILLTRLTGLALYQRYSQVMTAEERGIAQRTGSVSAQIRAGRHIHTSSLYSNHTDYLLGLEPLEALRKLPLCRGGSVALLSDLQFPPGSLLGLGRTYPELNSILTAFKSRCQVELIPMRQLLAQLQLPDRFSSVVMFGVFCASYGFAAGFAEKLLIDVVPPKVLQQNQYALNAGYQWLEQQVQQRLLDQHPPAQLQLA